MDRPRVAVIYQTMEGHTAAVAAKVAEVLGWEGVPAEVVELSHAPASLDGYAGVMLGGSVHVGHHDQGLAAYARAHRDAIAAMPSAFFSVSLAAADKTGRDHDQLMKIVTKFLEDASWRPDVVALIGGALAYTKYGFIKRHLMKHISAQHGGETDTSRDWDLTDWAAVEEFARDFGKLVNRPPGRAEELTR